jgi:PAS domain S-box-containing protein
MMLNWINPYLGASLFIPHGHCYLWKPQLVGLHVLSDAVIAFAYYSIPLTLFYFVRRRRDLPFTWVFLLFSAFIIACGTTHLMQIWTLWHPTYWLSGVIKLITAAISLTTAVLLVPIIPQALALPSPTQLELANWTLQQEVAKRKQIEAELIHSRDLREAIFNESTDALFLVDPQTLLTLDCNQRAIELFQATDKANLIGIEGRRLQRHQFSQDELNDIVAEMQAKGFWSREIEYVTHQGNIFWGNIAAKPITVAERVMNLVRVTDITDRKQAELSLFHLAAIVESSGDAIIGKSLDGMITSWNAGAEKIFGYEAAEVIGRPIAILFPPEQADELSQVLEQINYGKTIDSYETVRIRKDGQLINIAATISPIYDATGQVIGAAKIARDITARKRAEAAIHQSEARYRAIVQDQTELIVRFQPDGTFTFVNDAYCHYFGLDQEHLIGHRYAPVVFAADRDRVDRLVQSLSRENSTVVIENRVVVGGEVRWTQWVNHALFDPQGDLLEVQAVGRDIDDLKQAEQALQEREAFLRAIGDNIPNGYLFQLIRELDGRYRFTYISAGIERVSGLNPEAILADSSLMFNLLVEDDLPYVLQKGEESAQNLSVFDVQVRERLSNGEIRWLRLCSTPRRLEDGRVIWDGIRLDIHDLKQTEESLRQSEERWHLAISGSNDGIWDHNLRTNAHYLSPRCLEMLGYEYHEVDRFDQWVAHIHPDDRARLQATFQAHIEHQSPYYACEYRMQSKDGSYKWLLARGQVLWDEQGNPLRAVGSLTDISDRKQIEEALRQSEVKNRAMLAAIPDLLLRVRRDGTCLDFIPPLTSESGKFLFVEQNLSEILPPDLLQHQLQRIEQALATGELQVWEHQLTKDGRLSDEEIRLTPCGEDEVLVIVRDISEAKRGEAERKQAEIELELQSLIVRNIAEGVCMVKAADGIIVYANPKFERMFGYDVGELKGNHVSIVNYEDEHINSEAVHQQIAATILQQGEATYEVHNVKKDGTPIWCQATTSLFEHPDYGTVLVAVQQDITERKQTEMLIQTSLREKEVLLKEIHHRVKNNLGVVDGLLDMQARRSPNLLVVDALKESQNRIASIALVHEKLYGSDDLANIDFAQYISDLTAHLFDSYNIRSSQIELTTHVDAIPLDIDTAIPCGLIINELVSNALKYAFPNMQTGTIQVTIHQPQDRSLSLSVSDNGVGLPPDFNLNQTKTLGITLVKGLVKQLKGTLEIQTQPGTTFIISLRRT